MARVTAAAVLDRDDPRFEFLDALPDAGVAEAPESWCSCTCSRPRWGETVGWGPTGGAAAAHASPPPPSACGCLSLAPHRARMWCLRLCMIGVLLDVAARLPLVLSDGTLYPANCPISGCALLGGWVLVQGGPLAAKFTLYGLGVMLTFALVALTHLKAAAWDPEWRGATALTFAAATTSLACFDHGWYQLLFVLQMFLILMRGGGTWPDDGLAHAAVANGDGDGAVGDEGDAGTEGAGAAAVPVWRPYTARRRLRRVMACGALLPWLWYAPLYWLSIGPAAAAQSRELSFSILSTGAQFLALHANEVLVALSRQPSSRVRAMRQRLVLTEAQAAAAGAAQAALRAVRGDNGARGADRAPLLAGGASRRSLTGGGTSAGTSWARYDAGTPSAASPPPAAAEASGASTSQDAAEMEHLFGVSHEGGAGVVAGRAFNGARVVHPFILATVALLVASSLLRLAPLDSVSQLGAMLVLDPSGMLPKTAGEAAGGGSGGPSAFEAAVNDLYEPVAIAVAGALVLLHVRTARRAFVGTRARVASLGAVLAGRGLAKNAQGGLEGTTTSGGITLVSADGTARHATGARNGLRGAIADTTTGASVLSLASSASGRSINVNGDSGEGGGDGGAEGPLETGSASQAVRSGVGGGDNDGDGDGGGDAAAAVPPGHELLPGPLRHFALKYGFDALLNALAVTTLSVSLVAMVLHFAQDNFATPSCSVLSHANETLTTKVYVWGQTETGKTAARVVVVCVVCSLAVAATSLLSAVGSRRLRRWLHRHVPSDSSFRVLILFKAYTVVAKCVLLCYTKASSAFFYALTTLNALNIVVVGLIKVVRLESTWRAAGRSLFSDGPSHRRGRTLLAAFAFGVLWCTVYAVAMVVYSHAFSQALDDHAQGTPCECKCCSDHCDTDPEYVRCVAAVPSTQPQTCGPDYSSGADVAGKVPIYLLSTAATLFVIELVSNEVARFIQARREARKMPTDIAPDGSATRAGIALLRAMALPLVVSYPYSALIDGLQAGGWQWLGMASGLLWALLVVLSF